MSAVREEFHGDVLVIDPDEQRERIAGVRRLQEADPFGWPEKTSTDAFKLANGLRDEGIKQHVNLLIDGSMSDAGNSIRTIEALQKKGYEVEVRAISTHWLESELGINRRFTSQIDEDGVARDVDMDFHNRVYNDWPGNMEKVADATSWAFDRCAMLESSGLSSRIGYGRRRARSRTSRSAWKSTDVGCNGPAIAATCRRSDTADQSNGDAVCRCVVRHEAGMFPGWVVHGRLPRWPDIVLACCGS